MAPAAEEKFSVLPWWLVLLQGIAALIFGILLVARTGITTLVLVQFIGIYWLVAGIFGIVNILADRSRWGWKLLSGALGIIAGIIVIQYPLRGAVVISATVIIIIAIQGIIVGAIGLYQAFKGAGWGAGILGMVSILLGLLLLTEPLKFGLALPIIIGVVGIVGGIAAIVAAFRLR